jgi:NTE family protein
MRRTIILFLMVWLAVGAGHAQESPTPSQPRIGLVLSGGGAMGAAEVGALKVIERCGVPIHCIAGTSIGSIVGALHALGYRAEELDSLFRSQRWAQLFADGNLVGFFEQFTTPGDTCDFSTLPIPFACVAVDMQTQREVVLTRGSLARAMRASMAIPGVFKPVKIDGRLLIDGGMLNVLPTDVAKAMGADIIIAVDVQQKDHPTRHFSLKNILGIGGFLDWAVSRPDWRKYNANRRLADIYIRPDLSGFSVLDFNASDIARMIELGEKAAMQHEEALRELKR